MSVLGIPGKPTIKLPVNADVASETSTKEAGRKPQVQHLQDGGQRGTPPYEHDFPSSSDLVY